MPLKQWHGPDEQGRHGPGKLTASAMPLTFVRCSLISAIYAVVADATTAYGGSAALESVGSFALSRPSEFLRSRTEAEPSAARTRPSSMEASLKAALTSISLKGIARGGRWEQCRGP